MARNPKKDRKTDDWDLDKSSVSFFPKLLEECA